MTNINRELTRETILAQNADAIRALRKAVINDIIEIGRLLTQAKQIVGHGNWLPWLEREFQWTDDTALNYMRCHEMAKSRKFRDLNLPVSGLYLLAAPSTPEEAREAVIARTESGERLSFKDVRGQISDTKTKADRAAVKQPMPMPDVRAAADRAEGLIAEHDMPKLDTRTDNKGRKQQAHKLKRHPPAPKSRAGAPVKPMTAEQACRRLHGQILAVVAAAIALPMERIIDELFDTAADFAKRNGDAKKFVQRVRHRIDSMDKAPATSMAPAMASDGDER